MTADYSCLTCDSELRIKGGGPKATMAASLLRLSSMRKALREGDFRFANAASHRNPRGRSRNFRAGRDASQAPPVAGCQAGRRVFVFAGPRIQFAPTAHSVFDCLECDPAFRNDLLLQRVLVRTGRSGPLSAATAQYRGHACGDRGYAARFDPTLAMVGD